MFSEAEIIALLVLFVIGISIGKLAKIGRESKHLPVPLLEIEAEDGKAEGSSSEDEDEADADDVEERPKNGIKTRQMVRDQKPQTRAQDKAKREREIVVKKWKYQE